MTYEDPDDLARRVAGAASGRPLLLLMDFDGTLCEFAPAPEQVWLTRPRREAIQRLIAMRDVTAGFVSGRRLADVRERVGLLGDIWVAGLHGLEIEGFGERFVHERIAEARGLLGLMARTLRVHTAPLPGVRIEDKELTLAMHVRQAHPDDKIKADAEFLRMSLPHIEDGTLRLMSGSNVSELLPNVPWSKGDAVKWIQARESARRGADPMTIYLGDDHTDEDAFIAVGAEGSIIVGPRPSRISTRLVDPTAVESFLRALASRLARD